MRDEFTHLEQVNNKTWTRPYARKRSQNFIHKRTPPTASTRSTRRLQTNISLSPSIMSRHKLGCLQEAFPSRPASPPWSRRQGVTPSHLRLLFLLCVLPAERIGIISAGCFPTSPLCPLVLKNKGPRVLPLTFSRPSAL